MTAARKRDDFEGEQLLAALEQATKRHELAVGAHETERFLVAAALTQVEEAARARVAAEEAEATARAVLEAAGGFAQGSGAGDAGGARLARACAGRARSTLRPEVRAMKGCATCAELLPVRTFHFFHHMLDRRRIAIERYLAADAAWREHLETHEANHAQA